MQFLFLLALTGFVCLRVLFCTSVYPLCSSPLKSVVAVWLKSSFTDVERCRSLIFQWLVSLCAVIRAKIPFFYYRSRTVFSSFNSTHKICNVLSCRNGDSGSKLLSGSLLHKLYNGFFFKFPLSAFLLHTGGWLFQNYQKHVINYILMTWFLDKKAQVIFLLKFSV